jgi:DNA (cytosine-5)-methyltransferase 1
MCPARRRTGSNDREEQVNVGSLFAGIGGFELGLERAGMRIEWQVEVDPYCRAVLERRFPDARRFADVREVGAENLPPVDLLCGGFPCQDLSPAGKGAGIDGTRSGLWSEFARLIRELRPGYVLVENVPALLTGRGKRWDRAPIGRVLGDLAEARYDAEWACLSAREFGAPHLRKRVWIVGYRAGAEGRREALADPARDAEAGSATAPGAERERAGQGGARGRAGEPSDPEGRRSRPRRSQCAGEAGPATRTRRSRGHWAVEPGVGRVAHGVPDRVDRLAALGNALVPEIAEWIGGRILAHEEAARVRDREVRPPARRGAHPDARPLARRGRCERSDVPLHRRDRAGSKTARSNPDLEADS